MRFLSVCSGIEAASVAWSPLGWKAVGFSEIEPFPCSVLAHHYPAVPNRGDMTKFEEWPDDAVDLLCGGTPCQSFSVAGLRKGLDDPRGNLMLTYGAIAARHRPRWLVWENVPGVLSSNGGGDFGSLLGLLGELGYGFAYRVLDAQHFGVPQRRRRVFVVGCFGDWRAAAAVLFERESLSGHPAPRREAREDTAGTLAGGSRKRGGFSYDDVPPAGTLTANGKAAGSATQQDAECGMLIAHSLRGEGFDASEDGTGRGTSLVPVHCFDARQADVLQYGPISGPMDTGFPGPTIAFDSRMRGAEPAVGREERPPQTMIERTGAIDATKPWNVATAMQVRRLTPRECERLQGFPDDYTAVSHRGKPAADGPRYKALGNSWAVPCARWIGERIAAVDALPNQQRAAG